MLQTPTLFEPAGALRSSTSGNGAEPAEQRQKRKITGGAVRRGDGDLRLAADGRRADRHVGRKRGQRDRLFGDARHACQRLEHRRAAMLGQHRAAAEQRAVAAGPGHVDLGAACQYDTPLDQAREGPGCGPF